MIIVNTKTFEAREYVLVVHYVCGLVSVYPYYFKKNVMAAFYDQDFDGVVRAFLYQLDDLNCYNLIGTISKKGGKA